MQQKQELDIGRDNCECESSARARWVRTAHQVKDKQTHCGSKLC